MPRSIQAAQHHQEREQKALLRAFSGTVRHYWGTWSTVFSGVKDPRNPHLIRYSLPGLLFSGAFLFLCQLGSRRGLNDRLQGNGPAAAKFAAWFGMASIPHGDSLNYTFRRLEVAEVQEVVCRSMETLIRKKVLARYRLLGLYYLVAIDGTGVLTFRERHCPHCLTKTFQNGQTIYYHPVLEAKLVTANGFAFSLMIEFIENADLSADKQDCELSAFYRLSKRLKARFPRLPICLFLDGLYAGGPTFQVCNCYDWKYLVVLREDDLPQLHRSFAAVLPHLPDQRKQVRLEEVNSQKRTERVVQTYRWAEGPSYADSQKRVHSLNLIECQETRTDPRGQVAKLHYKWITNFSLTSRNVARLTWSVALQPLITSAGQPAPKDPDGKALAWIPEGGPIAGFFQAHQRPVRAAGLRQALIGQSLPAVEAELLSDRRIWAWFPLQGRQGLIGVLLLGAKRGARELSPQVLVLDIHMPGMKAVEILNTLADFPAPPATLVLSAYGDPENVFGMLEAGARGYMLKDADPEQIAEGIRTVAAGKRWLSQEILEVVLTQRLPAKEILPARHERLSDREREVLILLGQGLNNAQIAERMQLSETTVKNHVTSLYDKLDLHSRAEAVAYAWQHGLIQG